MHGKSGAETQLLTILRKDKTRIETVLSLKSAPPKIPMAAALSAAHLAAWEFPTGLRGLIVAADNDPAGKTAARKLADRAKFKGVDIEIVESRGEDFNEDLRVASLVRLSAENRACSSVIDRTIRSLVLCNLLVGLGLDVSWKPNITETVVKNDGSRCLSSFPRFGRALCGDAGDGAGATQRLVRVSDQAQSSPQIGRSRTIDI